MKSRVVRCQRKTAYLQQLKQPANLPERFKVVNNVSPITFGHLSLVAVRDSGRLIVVTSDIMTPPNDSAIYTIMPDIHF